MLFFYLWVLIKKTFGTVHFDSIMERIERQIYDPVKNMRTGICFISRVLFKTVVIVDSITTVRELDHYLQFFVLGKLL